MSLSPGQQGFLLSVARLLCGPRHGLTMTFESSGPDPNVFCMQAAHPYGATPASIVLTIEPSGQALSASGTPLGHADVVHILRRRMERQADR